MKTSRIFRLCLMVSALAASLLTQAADIDIYSDNSGTAGVPNVLLVLDNGANFSSAAANCTYVNDGTAGGTTPSLNGTAGGIEQCAIYNVVSSLPAGSVNLGLMLYNGSNIRDVDGLNCNGSNGGCLAQPLVNMSGAAKTKFLAWIKTWKTSSGGSDSNGYIKASGDAIGATMQEAWAYYAGRTGLSGRTYTAPSPGCQKNFVIFIGNAFTVNGKPGDSGTADPIGALALAGATTAQKEVITIPSGSYGTSAFSCGSYTMGNSHNTKNAGLYADEWARYMYQTDLYGAFDDKQGITTYTVGLLGAACTPEYPALLTSMAKVGGGKYFGTSGYEEISTAILKILNEVQAVNSVFSSASLPVSVNAQGTYLNQIFLGMFRPDGSASPRWLGNLKQYKFILEYPDPSNPDPNKATLKLGDSNGDPAISAAGTGFITSTAVSYWTKKDTAVAPDSTGGFFVADPHGAGGAFDKQDGELVEKGGAAQVLRTRNLSVNYASTPDSPRKLYTYCPSGAACNENLTHSSNAFATTNAGVTDALASTAVTVSVSSITAVKAGSQITATAVTNTNHNFLIGDTVTISGANPSGYNGPQTILTKTDRGFTFVITGSGQAPAAATGTIIATKAGANNSTALINWVRGEDNFGDEKSPGSGYTVRPSIHGDVLHSRPVVVNYGDTRGLVIYYGANDGVFRAVNGSQTQDLGTVPAGGELWGLVLKEHFPQLNRQRINSPELKLPSTPSGIGAEAKDYFMDGSPGLYQTLNDNGTVNKAYLYLNMRRGGRFIYALDVTTPTAPKFLWKKSYSDISDTAFAELGQTWSRPRVTLVKGYVDATTGKPKPVLVFGAGYDSAEDAEPPAAGTMGRGIFVLDAESGARIWSAAFTSGAASCSGTSAQASCAVPEMKWAIPAEISFLDRDNNGLTDRFYASDVGGNVWRVDLEAAETPGGPVTPDKWKISQFAALGCAAGVCASGTTPRKFFYPPNVVSVGKLDAIGAYDAVMLGSGDREHPLISTATGSSHQVVNRFYVLKDTKVGKNATGSTLITEAGLVDATTTAYASTADKPSGFYSTLATGEKTVNASTTTRGTTFFGTNRPVAPIATSCKSNLGEAKGYALSPFTGKFDFTIYDGGGLPPSPIVGIVNIEVGDKTIQKEFCIGCGGGDGGDGKSPLGAGDLTKKVPKNLRRTYWYKK
ncbi:MAG: PilC/PilY family type IV pilus protein [Burkholderiaceae bacterium]|nr:PilC/PilY family type IV pilus protein [Burkholderiaceae bacterium]